MSITPVNAPTLPPPVPQQQTVVAALPAVHAQAVPPIGQDAVAPPPKTEKGQKTKERREKDPKDRHASQEKEGEHEGHEHTLDLSV